MSDIVESVDLQLDTSGLNCPLPILKTKKALSTMLSGQLIRVMATDPASRIDFAAYCAQTGHQLIEESAEDGRFVFVLRKK
ncbi:MAG: Sulfur carrier protein TusA [Gammaproteobacteria bacterium]|nr:Sulfur carrier protein TusA [Gammaproteobacteria bacterium]